MSHPSAIERRQVWVYLAAAGLGLGLGRLAPPVSPAASGLVWPALALLMYATFTQISPTSMRDAWTDRRFHIAALLANFVVVPAFVALLLRWAPDDPAVRLGILITLVAPCTDWFITFTHLGRGNASHAASLAPLSMIVQLPLIPLYARLLGLEGTTLRLGPREILPAAGVIVLPLLGAWLMQARLRSRSSRAVGPWSGPDIESRWRTRWAWVPVPALALVILLVMTAHVNDVAHAAGVIPRVGGVYVAYLAGALFIAKGLSLMFRLSPSGSRTLAFSVGTRNSFVVLPLALSLPQGWELTAVVVVLQSLIELLGMIAYLWIVPRLVFRDRPPKTA